MSIQVALEKPAVRDKRESLLFNTTDDTNVVGATSEQNCSVSVTGYTYTFKGMHNPRLLYLKT